MEPRHPTRFDIFNILKASPRLLDLLLEKRCARKSLRNKGFSARQFHDPTRRATARNLTIPDLSFLVSGHLSFLV